MNQQKGFEGPSVKESFNIVYSLMQAQATIVTPFIRTSFGAEALGWPGLGAFIALCLWVIGTASADLEFYMFLWFVAMLVQRAKTLIDGIRGNYQHSRYAGYPLTALLCRHEGLAKLMEGALVLVAGVAIEGVCWPLSHLLMASGVCIIFLEGINWHYHQKLAEARRDSVIEMQQMGNPLRPQWQRR